ncbi:hypothetical protein DFH28DRAFT_1081281 [Melampsora americana]|nr:hypothetical protein DFH28DRAFT_1081281 [Melampsora americana]
MVVPTLIHEWYHMLQPGAPLPKPRERGQTGLRCPLCSLGMIYKKPYADAWLIACPTNQHHFRTWRCDQLKYEMDRINAGEPRPIISQPADWGPRRSPFGEFLPSPPIPTNELHYHPFLNRNVGQASLRRVRPTRTNYLECKRIHEGPTSQNHKKAANKECPFQYCLGVRHHSFIFFSILTHCCTTFGSAICRKHPRTTPGPINHPQPLIPGDLGDRIATGSLVPTSTAASHPQRVDSTPSLFHPTVASSSRRPATAATAAPHQWAQASNTLGRRIPSHTLAMLHKNRADRDALGAQPARIFDENKLITISLWVEAGDPQHITAHFPTWPLAALDESALLLEALSKAAGPQWNRALSVWDESLHAWCNTMVQFPRRYTQSQRTILARLPDVFVPTSSLPQATRERLSEHVAGSKTPASAFLSDSDLPPIFDIPSSPKTPTKPLTSALATEDSKVKSPNPVVIELDGEPESPDLPRTPFKVEHSHAATPQATPTRVHLDLTESPEAPHGPSPEVRDSSQVNPNPNSLTRISTPPPSNQSAVKPLDGCASTTASPRLKKGWPSSSIPVSTLLKWFEESIEGNIKERWKSHWGGEWLLVPPTMYRYRAWIEMVGYRRFVNSYEKQPNATVGDARVLFSAEFNKKAGLVKDEPVTEA